jgi:putative SOS response-associated peptidase YedK
MRAHFTIKRDEEKIRLRDKILIYGAVPRADIKPTDLAPIIIPENDDYLLTQMRWGWRVPWDKSPLINAKSETLTTLPTFKAHLQNRCLILADGFYEKGVRFIQPGGGSFAMAWLWQPNDDGKRFTMLTTMPNATVAPYHNRMPFILPPDR